MALWQKRAMFCESLRAAAARSCCFLLARALVPPFVEELFTLSGEDPPQ